MGAGRPFVRTQAIATSGIFPPFRPSTFSAFGVRRAELFPAARVNGAHENDGFEKGLALYQALRVENRIASRPNAYAPWFRRADTAGRIRPSCMGTRRHFRRGNF